MEYFKPGEQMSVMTQAYSEKEIPSSPNIGVEPTTFGLLVRTLYH